MGTEAIVIPIIVDPKAGVAGLKQFGEASEKAGKQFEGGSGSAFKFSDSMKKMGANLLQMVGIMKLADVATKAVVESFMDWVSGAYKMADAQKLIAQAHEQAAINSQEELVKLQALIGVAKDANNSYTSRKGAIDELLKLYPDLQGQLTLEKINTEAAAAAVDKLTQSLLNRATADLLVKQIAQMNVELMQFEKVNSKLGGGLFSMLGGSGDSWINSKKNIATELMAELQKMMSGNLKTDLFKNFGSQLGKASKDQLGKFMFGNYGKMLSNILFPEELKPKKIKVKPEKIEVRPGIGSYDLELPTVFDTKDTRSRLQKQMDDLNSVMTGGKQAGVSPDISRAIMADFDRIAAELEKRKLTLQEIIAESERMGNMVADFLTPAFDDMFNAIFSNEEPLKAFFESIGQSIQQLIGQLISAAIRAAILSMLTGGAAAGGLSFGSAFKKSLGFAQGGLVTGPVSALVGEGHGTSRSNPEVVAPLDRLQVFFRNMMQGNAGFSTPQNMGVSGSMMNVPAFVEIRGRGRDLYGVLELEKQSIGRTG